MVVVTTIAIGTTDVAAQATKKDRPARAKIIRDEDLPYPPTLPGEAAFVSDKSPLFLQRPETLHDDVTVAKTPPQIDFLFYPQQTYPGKPWSNWGGGCVADGKYYSAIGDHYAIGRGASPHSTGNAFVYEYDPATRQLRTVVDLAKVLKLPADNYRPGKIHSRVDMGSDGWLVYATHRGSPKAASDANHYQGDWILRTNPNTGQSEVVAHGPVPKHSIPNSMLDPERLIFYGGTAAGPDAESQEIQFFAYDLAKRKLLYAGPNGPARYMILAASTGYLYFVPGNDEGELMRFDPANPGPPKPTGQTMGIRAATGETQDGLVYAVSKGQGAAEATLWKFNTRSEQAERVGLISVGAEAYVASIAVDPSGRFLYYIPGAHGGGYRDGSPVVQYDVKQNSKKVIAFLHPFYQEKYGFTPKGTYSCALSEDGAQLFVTWNVSRGTRAWDCCGLTVIHIPETER
jgi:hypothetical protein